MINQSNYYQQINDIDFSQLPEAIRKTKDFVDVVTANGTSWEKYNNSPGIKKTIDLYFDKLNQAISKEDLIWFTKEALVVV